MQSNNRNPSNTPAHTSLRDAPRAGTGQGSSRTPRSQTQRRTPRPAAHATAKVWNVQDKRNTPFSPVQTKACMAFLFGNPDLPADVADMLEHEHAPFLDYLRNVQHQLYVGEFHIAYQEAKMHPNVASACASLGFRAGDVLEIILSKNSAAVQRGEPQAVSRVKGNDPFVQGIAADPVLVVESVLELLDWQFDQRIAKGGR